MFQGAIPSKGKAFSFSLQSAHSLSCMRHGENVCQTNIIKYLLVHSTILEFVSYIFKDEYGRGRKRMVVSVLINYYVHIYYAPSHFHYNTSPLMFFFIFFNFIVLYPLGKDIAPPLDLNCLNYFHREINY